MPDLSVTSSTMCRSRASLAIDLAISVLLALGVYAPYILTSETLYKTNTIGVDMVVLSQPAYVYTGERLAAGELPLWNPYWLAGYPHLAMPSAGVFYPTTVVFGLLDFPTAYRLLTMLHVALLGVFSYLLGRSLFNERVPALLLALLIPGSNIILQPLGYGQLWTIQTLTWFVPVVLFIDRLVKGRSAWNAIGLAAAVLMMQLGGDSQSVAYGFYLLAAYVAVNLAGSVATRKLTLARAVRAGLLCVAGIALGLGLSAIQTVPSQELLGESVRAHGVTRALMKIVVGEVPPNYVDLVLQPEVPQHTIWRSVGGRLGLAFAALSLFSMRRLESCSWMFAAAACALYASMPEWYYETVIRHLPVYDSIRGVRRILHMCIFATGVLAGFGVNSLWTAYRARDPGLGRQIAFVGLVTLMLVGYPYLRGQSLATGELIIAVGGTLSAACALHPRMRTLAIASLIGLPGVHAFYANQRAIGDWSAGVFDVLPEFERFARSRGGDGRIAIVEPVLGSPLLHGQGIGLLTGDRTIHGSHDLHLARFIRMFRDVAGLPFQPADQDGRQDVFTQDGIAFVGDWVTPRSLPVLDLFNVQYIASTGLNRLEIVRTHRQGRFARLPVEGMIAYENRRALPPMFPVHDVVHVADDREALALMAGGKIDWRHQATVAEPIDPRSLAPATGPEPMSIVQYDPERIQATIELTAPALVVFSEIYYPGWEATIDETPAEVVCAYTALRAVVVDAGFHEIVLEFRPRSLRIGAVVTALSCGIAAVWIAVLARRRNSANSRPATAD